MPTVPTRGWAQLLAQLSAQPGAGAHGRVSSAQLQGSDNPEGKTPLTAQALLPGSSHGATHRAHLCLPGLWLQEK